MRVHGFDLVSWWCAQNFNNFNDLFRTTLAWKERHREHKFCDDASDRPNVNWTVVFCTAENKFWCSVIPWSNVRNIRLTVNQLFCAAVICQFNNMAFCIDQDVLRLDVAMTNTHWMQISGCPQKLIRIQFDVNILYILLLFHIILHHFVQIVRVVVHDDVEIKVFWTLAISIKMMPHFDTKRVAKDLEDSQLTTFVSAIYEDFLDSYRLIGLFQCQGTIRLSFFKLRMLHGLVHNSKWPITNNLVRIIYFRIDFTLLVLLLLLGGLVSILVYPDEFT